MIIILAASFFDDSIIIIITIITITIIIIMKAFIMMEIHCIPDPQMDEQPQTPPAPAGIQYPIR